jgi:acyl-CoA thioesterase-1
VSRQLVLLAQYAFVFFTLISTSAVSNAQVVALGASNTAGTYPAQLEAMLKAKRCNVSVVDAGVSGDTTGGMLARLDSAVPQGTRVVILQPGTNDRRIGVPSQVPEILARLHVKGIKVVMLENATLNAFPSGMHQDRKHLTAEGYSALAAQLLPRVIAALGSSCR